MILLGLFLVLLAGAAIALIATEESPRYILFGRPSSRTTRDVPRGRRHGGRPAGGDRLITWFAQVGAAPRRQRTVRADASDRVAKLEEEKRELERKLEHERATDTTLDERLVAGSRRKPRGDLTGASA